MPNHLAALGYSQLIKLNKFNINRNKIAKIYNKNLTKISKKIIPPYTPDYCTHSYQMYTVRVPQKLRNRLIYFLNKNNIEASAHFDPPLHKQRYLKKFNKYKLPNTDKLCKEIVTLPIYPDMTKKK